MAATRRLLLLGLPATLGLAGCGQAVKSAMSDAMGAPKGSDVVLGADVLKGTRKLVIAGFMVDYVTEFRLAASSSNLGTLMFTDAPTNATIRSTGVDPATLPALTDRMYDSFVADATAAGYSVVPHANLAAQPGYPNYASGGTPSPATEDGSAGKGIFVSARGLPLFYIQEEAFAPAFSPFGIGRNNQDKDDFLPFTSRFAAGFSSVSALQSAQNFAKTLDATAVMVRVTVAGGALTHNQSFWTGGTVSTGAGLSFAPFVTRLAFIDGNGNRARVALGAPVVTADGGTLADVTSATTTAMDIAGNTLRVASIAVAATMGGRGIGGASREKTYEYRVEPARFPGMVQEGWSQASRKLLALSKGA